MDKIEVKIELKETSQPIVRQAVSTYTKGPMFCVYDGTRVEKYPIESIFRITENYSPSKK